MLVTEGFQQGPVDGVPAAEPVVVGIGADHPTVAVDVGPVGELQADPLILLGSFLEIALGDRQDDYPRAPVLQGGGGALVDVDPASEVAQ